MPGDRMNFIPELKERIMKDLVNQGVSRSMSVVAFEKWDKGELPTTPWERGCFGVFEHIQEQINRGGEA